MDAWHTATSFPLQPVMAPPYTIEVPGERVAGETLPRRHPKAKDGLMERPAPEVDTVFALVRRTALRTPERTAIGSRSFVRVQKEVKQVAKVVDGVATTVDKEWTYFELSDYTYTTYAAYYAQVLQVGAALRTLGVAKHDRVHVFASTSAQWLSIAHGCSSQSLTIVTAYDTLGAAGVQHSLVQTGAVAMFVDPHLLKTTAGPIRAAPALRYVIYNDLGHQPVPASEIEAFRAEHAHLKVLSFSELCTLGTDAATGQAVAEPDPPTPDETFCIMYTSGSTGLPKGVPVTHAGFVASVAGLNSVFEESVSPAERILAYLPLAHIFELILENLVLLVGGTLGYGSPRTLTDGSMVAGCAGDLRAFKPTVLVGVPQVWETVRKGVVAGVENASPVARSVFWGYYGFKNALMERGLLAGPVAALVARLDKVIFSKVRTMTGGQLRFIVNGASGIADNTKRFLSLVVAPMAGGYGLTETCGNGSLGSPLQYTNTAIGAMPASIEIKLVSQPELGYDATPAAGSGADPHGEIWIRGAPVLKAYFDNADETAKVLTADGWFRTGDIGAFDAVGHLRVVDRMKNLIKMQGGEYIALEKLEAIYRGAATVLNLMVHGDSEHTRPIAVVCVNEKALEDLAAKNGIVADSSGSTSLTEDARVRTLVLKQLQAVAKAAELAPIEVVQGVCLVDEEWTPASGLVTATQKLNRNKIREAYKEGIKQAFGDK